MDIKTISVAFVAIMVGAVAFGAMLPIFQDVTATEDTYTNDGYFTYDMVTDDTDVTFTWDPTEPKKLTFGGKSIDLSGVTNANLTIVGSDNFTCRYYSNNSVAGGLQTYGVGGYKSYNPDNETATVTITVDVSTLAFDGTTDKTYTMGNRGFVLNPNGDGPLTLKYPTEKAYVNGDSDVYLCGTTFVTGSGTNDFVGVFGYGSIDDGITLSSFYGNTGGNTVSFGDPVITSTEVTSHIDLYQIEKVDFELTQNSASVNATYSYFVVPTEVTAERAIHGDSGFNTIVNLIPLVIGMGLLLIAVWWFVVRKF